jgi:hypothetical protein
MSNATLEAPAGPPPDAGCATKAGVRLRAVHPPNSPALLRQLGASLLFTTCQKPSLPEEMLR